MSTLGSLVIRIVGDNSEFNKSIAQTQKQLNASTKGLQTIAKGMTTVGDSMVKGITVPILAIGGVLFKLGEEFDNAYDKIRIGTGKTGDEFKGLQADFKAVAKVAASSFDDISTAITGYNKTLGLTDKPLQNLSIRILNLSRLTKTDLNANVSESSKVINNWKIATEDQNETLELMYRASKKADISVTDLMADVADSGQILRAMGYDIVSSTALIASFDKAGVDVGGTIAGMKKALVEMAKEGFTDPQEVLAMYIEKIKGAKNNIEATEIAAELFGARGGANMAIAIREGRLDLDGLIESLKTGKDSINEIADSTNDWKEKLILLRNNIGIALEPLATKVFDALGRGVDKVTPKIEGLARWFGNLSPEMQDNLIKWGLLAAVLPLVISGLGRAITGITKTRNSILLLNAAIKSSPLFTSIAALGLSAGQLSAIVAALGLTAKGLNNVTLSIIDNEKESKNWGQILSDIVGVLTLNPKYLNKSMMSIFGWTDATKEATKATEEQNVGIGVTNALTMINKNVTTEAKIAAQDHKNAIEALAAQYPELTDAELEEKLAMDEGTGAINEQTEAIDKLIKEFNEFIDDLFGSITTYNDFQEANWAVEDAQKELTEAIKEYGEGSREAEHAQNLLDDTMIASIETAFKLSQEINATTEEQEEARKKAVELGLEYVNTGLISIESFIEMATQFGLSSADIIKYADEMGIVIDEATRARLTEITADATDLFGVVGEVNKALNSIPKRVTTTIDIEYNRKAMENAPPGVKKLLEEIQGGALGGIFNGQEFLRPMVSASRGMIIPKFDSGGVLAMLHPPEIVLNAREAMNVLWNMANRPIDTKQGAGNGIVMHNTFNSPKPLTESEINRNMDITARILGYKMGLN